MPAALPRYDFPLFVPADRPDRIGKALSAGTGTVIVDLEDAVAPASKLSARDGLRKALFDLQGINVWIRMNGSQTNWFEGDLELAAMQGVSGVMLPKSEHPDDLVRVRAGLREDQALIALIETARGMLCLSAIAGLCDRMAFGSIDYARDLGCAGSREVLYAARTQLVLTARGAGQPPPLDGVTLSLTDPAETESDAIYARDLGFGGKLLIHPSQIAPARQGFRPSPERLDWARQVVAAVGDGSAVRFQGGMLDAPMVAAAQDILRYSEMLTG